MEPGCAIRSIPVPDKSIGLISSKSKNQLERKEDGSLILNQRNLKILCERQGLYQFPELNNKLYLHFKVIDKIQNLNSYVNLKTLYLESNVIKKIENLSCLPELENLFLQNNMISKIQNLEGNKKLKVLNLSANSIHKIQGLVELVELQTLTISNNYLKTFDDLQQLGQCSECLTSIDLSGNQIEANQKLLDLVPQVKCLYLFGNPFVKDTVHYRRKIIGTLKNLLYLDQRTVDKQERITSEAYINGGEKGFKEAREQVLLLRQSQKKQAKQQLMQNIDKHRQNKIRRFQLNIEEYDTQINKLNQQMNDKKNQQMQYFYENRITELKQKIKQTQQFIQSLNKRMSNSKLSPLQMTQNNSKSTDNAFKKKVKQQSNVTLSTEYAEDKGNIVNASQQIQQKQSKEAFRDSENSNSIPYSIHITTTDSHSYQSSQNDFEFSQIITDRSQAYASSYANNQHGNLGNMEMSQAFSVSISQTATNTSNGHSSGTYSGEIQTYYSIDELD